MNQPALSLEKKMSNCPYCSKPVLNHGQFMGAAQFRIRCPWCQKNLMMNIEMKITAAPLEASSLEEWSEEADGMTGLEGGRSHEFRQQKPEPLAPPFDVSVGRGMKLRGFIYPDRESGPPL